MIKHRLSVTKERLSVFFLVGEVFMLYVCIRNLLMLLVFPKSNKNEKRIEAPKSLSFFYIYKAIRSLFKALHVY